MKHRAIEAYYGNERASKAIYGAILIFAFLITQSHAQKDSALTLAISTFFAAGAIVIAEIYAEYIGKSIKQKGKLTKSQRAEIVQDSLSILSVSYWPTLFFAASYFGLFSVRTAFDLSYVFLLAILFGFTYLSATLSGKTRLRAFANAAVTTSIGIAVVFIKYYFGH